MGVGFLKPDGCYYTDAVFGLTQVLTALFNPTDRLGLLR